MRLLMVVRGFLSRPDWPGARLRNFIWMSAPATSCASHTLFSPVETGWGLPVSQQCRSRQFPLRNSLLKKFMRTQCHEKGAKTPE